MQSQTFPYFGPLWNNTIWYSKTISSPKVFLCPSDPTRGQVAAYGQEFVNTELNYMGNDQVFARVNDKPGVTYTGTYTPIPMNHFPASISDGTSSTMMYTEQQHVCNWVFPGQGLTVIANWFNGGMLYDYFIDNNEPLSYYYSVSPPFQTQPTVAACIGILPQSGHTAGINVALCDGSVRFVGQGISTNTWMSIVTANAGDLQGSDW
jgi:hypothetical protein